MRTQTKKEIQRHLPRTEMSRAERRRLERDKEKQTKTYTLTQAQLDKLLDDAKKQASKRAMLMVMAVPLVALRDTFGFGQQRLERYMEKFITIWECYEADYVSLEDLMTIIETETGLQIKKLIK